MKYICPCGDNRKASERYEEYGWKDGVIVHAYVPICTYGCRMTPESRCRLCSDDRLEPFDLCEECLQKTARASEAMWQEILKRTG